MIPDDNLILPSRSHYRYNTVHIFKISSFAFLRFNLKRSLDTMCQTIDIFLPTDIFYDFLANSWYFPISIPSNILVEGLAN